VEGPVSIRLFRLAAPELGLAGAPRRSYFAALDRCLPTRLDTLLLAGPGLFPPRLRARALGRRRFPAGRFPLRPGAVLSSPGRQRGRQQRAENEERGNTRHETSEQAMT
jgi:hypothetical protein